MTELLISEVHPQSSTNTMLLTFQNGYTNSDFKSSNCKLLMDDTTKRKTAVAALDGLLYASEENIDNLLKTVLLIRDKSTGKVRLIESNTADMKPILQINTKVLQDTSLLELSRKFGSKKQKKQMEQKEKFKVKTEIVTEQMLNITENISEEKLDMTLYTKSDSEEIYIPPINRAADKVEEVYEISKILTDEQFDKIQSEISEKDYKSEIHPNILPLISKTTSQHDIILSLYASALIKMYSTLFKELSKKTFVVCEISSTLNEIVLTNFTISVGGKRTRPNTMKDKALCHALVFILIINKFKLKLDDFAAMAKLTAATATLKARAVGAHVTLSGDKKIIQLKLPLNSTSGFKRRKSAKF